MTKKYIANTHISLTIAMAEGKNAHISFTPHTGGGSVYYAKDERVQNALEKHPKFGKLFNIDKYYTEVIPEEVKPVVKPTKSTIKEINVTCLDDAKDYLSEKYGVSRTKMRSAEGIKSIASANNGVFIGLE